MGCRPAFSGAHFPAFFGEKFRQKVNRNSGPGSHQTTQARYTGHSLTPLTPLTPLTVPRIFAGKRPEFSRNFPQKKAALARLLTGEIFDLFLPKKGAKKREVPTGIFGSEFSSFFWRKIRQKMNRNSVEKACRRNTTDSPQNFGRKLA